MALPSAAEETRSEPFSRQRRTSQGRAVYLLAIALTLLLLIPSGTFAWRFRTMPQLGTYHDDAVYWISAQSLAHGEGYRIPNLPERPAQTKYPPLYPALLSLIWRVRSVFPENLNLLSAVQWSFVPLSLAMAWLYFRRCRFSPLSAYGLTLAIAATPMTIVFATLPMSELPFTVLLLALMLLIESRDDISTLRAWGAGLLASAAFLTRTNAIVLALSVPFLLLLKRRYRAAAAFTIPVAATIGVWLSWCFLRAFPARDNVLSYYTSYAGFYARTFSWTALPVHVWVNVDAAIESMARLVFFNFGEQWTRSLAWVITAAAGAGVVTLYRRGIRQYPVFAVLFIAMLLVWQYPADPRFVYPILPLFIAGLVTKLTEVARLAVITWKEKRGPDRVAAAVMLSMILLLAGGCAASIAYGSFSVVPDYFHDHRQQRAQMLPVYQWIAANTNLDERFAAYDDTLLYLNTGRRGYTVPILPALVYGPGSDAVPRYVSSLPDLWREKRVNYVLATQWDFQRDLHKPAQDSLNSLLHDRSRFLPVYSDPVAQVYRFVPAH